MLGQLSGQLLVVVGRGDVLGGDGVEEDVDERVRSHDTHKLVTDGSLRLGGDDQKVMREASVELFFAPTLNYCLINFITRITFAPTNQIRTVYDPPIHRSILIGCACDSLSRLTLGLSVAKEASASLRSVHSEVLFISPNLASYSLLKLC